MLGHPVEKMAVVADYQQAALEFLKVFLQDIEGHDVQVIGRLVENQQVRLLHQDGKQVEPALFASRKP